MVRDDDPKYNNLSYGFLDTEKITMFTYHVSAAPKQFL